MARAAHNGQIRSLCFLCTDRALELGGVQGFTPTVSTKERMHEVIKSTIDWQKPAQAANQYNVGARSVGIPCKTAARAQSAKDFFPAKAQGADEDFGTRS